MIKSKVLHKVSNQKGVRPQQIEKDYIISWLLWGISKQELLKGALIFKGGTCLKKIHIKNYRYSEDMDFTMNPKMENDISNEEIYSAFDEVFGRIRDAANINLSIQEKSKDSHEPTNSMKFYIDYVGPLGGNGSHIKLDITRGEQLEFVIEQEIVQHNYSDLKEEGNYSILCYSLKEVVIEKMVALMGRTIPRDLYDFDYLTDIEGIKIQDVYFEFKQKAEHKGLNPIEFIEKITGKQKTFEKAWNNNLVHQIKDLPKIKDVWRRIGKQLRKIEKNPLDNR